MLKLLAPKTCAFDCEWVPCPATARRLLHLPPTTSDREAMEAVWQHYSEQEAERTGRPPQPAARPFLKLILSQVVSVAAVLRQLENDKPKLWLWSMSIADHTEGELIANFLERVAKGQWQLWGFNSAEADLPILKQRAIALGVPCPEFSERPERNSKDKKYDYHDSRYGDGHKDMLEVIGGFGGGGAKKPSLNEFAVACGIPGKLDVAGDEVAELYLQGRLAEILEYNETDAVTTHLLMLRIGLHTGQLAPAAYAAEVEAVEQLVQQQIAKGKQQFAKFSAAWQRVPVPGKADPRGAPIVPNHLASGLCLDLSGAVVGLARRLVRCHDKPLPNSPADADELSEKLCYDSFWCDQLRQRNWLPEHRNL